MVSVCAIEKINSLQIAVHFYPVALQKEYKKNRMLGTAVNTAAIVIGSLIGLLCRGGIPDRYVRTITQALGLAVVLVGIKNAIQSNELLIIILSLSIGALCGEMIGIEAWLKKIGHWIEKKFSALGNGIAHGFVTASLLFCVGSMAIVGSLESGLTGNHQTLLAKSVLDGITSIIFTSTLGIGVLFSSVAVFCYEGAITLSATLLKPFLQPDVVHQMTSVGGLLIMAIGFNLLKIAKIKVGNMLPAVFIPLIYAVVKSLFQ